MAYDFPSSPTPGQEYTPTTGGQTYIWEAPRWLVKGIPPVGGGGGGGGINEAPIDSLQYGRQDGTWTEVAPNPTWTTLTGKPATFPPTLPIAESDVTSLVTDLAAKAPLSSPTFTGDPKAPTPAASDNDTSIATTAFVTTAIGGSSAAGAVAMFAKNTAPTGWLKANGAVLSRTTYAALFAAIGTTFGAGDGSTTFALPDLRGEFLRSWDDARGIDAARAFGTSQTGGVESHTHTFSATSAGRSAAHTHAVSGTTSTVSADHTHATTSSGTTATGSANHTHVMSVFGGQNANTAHLNASGDSNIVSGGVGDNSATGAAHTHTVTVSGSSGGISTNHTHTFADTSDTESVDHTHAVSGTSAANAGAAAETRPRNIALLACIKY